MSQRTSNLPTLDMSTSTTGCCPVFQPDEWDGKIFEFKDKPFIKDHTVSFMYIPLNMGRVMARMNENAKNGQAAAEDFVLLSSDTSPWHADHYYAVKSEMPDAENVKLSGRFFAKVYEGPFKDAGKWSKDLIEEVKQHGSELKQTFFYYTTCPNSAKVYGKNYVVGLAQIE